MMARVLEKEGVRSLLIDNRGAGKTECDLNQPLTLDVFAQDVLAVWEALEVNRSSLLGISMGGFIAQKIALMNSAKVDKLILASTAAISSWIRSSETPWGSNVDETRRKMQTYFSDDFVERNPMLVEAMVQQTTKALNNSNFLERADAQKAAVKNIDLRDALKDLKIESLIIHGSEDHVVPIEAAEELHGVLRGSRLNTFNGAGHLLLAEKPKEFYQLVAEFLKLRR
jgi:pimeloyl-ACP methyl ester carboxylesterase